MNWPTAQEYNEAIQNPSACFADSDLAQCKTAVNLLGLPRVASGNFASVYKVESAEQSWAVRCFLSNRSDQALRYKIISDFVLFDQLNCTVDFHYIEQGIRVAGNWFPVLKMPWIDGELLDQFVLKNVGRPQTILDLTRQFYRMIRELEDNDIAHGDLQHGNIIVTSDGLRLVDYDALFVPALAGFSSLELGHPNYQHPGRHEKHFDPTVDNFSTWLIYASLMCLAIDPSIHSQFESGDECLIFKRKDLTAPEKSIVFQTLLTHDSPEIRGLVKLVRRLLWLEPHTVPPLSLPDAANLSLTDVESVVASASEPADRPAQSQILADIENMDSEILDTLASTSKQSFLPVKRAPKHLSTVRDVVKQTRKRMEKILDTALHGLSPRRWLSMNLQEADSLIQSGEYEKALELYNAVHSRMDSMEPDEQMNLVLKIGRCYLLMNQSDMARNFFIVGARVIRIPGGEERICSIVDHKRTFFSFLVSKQRENTRIALSALTELLNYHQTIYYKKGAGGATGRSPFSISMTNDRGETTFFFDAQDFQRTNRFADELEEIFNYLEVAKDVASRLGTESSEWLNHLETVLKLAFVWQSGDFDIPRKSLRARECLMQIYNYADSISVLELPDRCDIALRIAMMKSSAGIKDHSSKLLDGLKRCTALEVEQVLHELSSRVSDQELLNLTAHALGQIGPSATMTNLVPLLWRLALKQNRLTDPAPGEFVYYDDALAWLSTVDESVINACLTEYVQKTLVDHAHAIFLSDRNELPGFLRKCAALGELAEVMVKKILSNTIKAMLLDKDKYSLYDVRTIRELTSEYSTPLEDWEELNEWFLSLTSKTRRQSG